MPSLDFKTWRHAQDVIGQGALTNSKMPSSHILGVYPTHILGGTLGYVLDENGKRYVDYICGLGSNLFGYSPPGLIETLTRNMQKGFSHSLPTVDEVETAEKLKAMFYFVDKWKFLKTGSEACSAAVRMARAYTGRKFILSEAYHGWHDEFVSLTPPASGVHTCLDIATYGDDIDLKDVAAVIVEPVVTRYDDERVKQLADLRERCTAAGAVLIFDEVITGFRFDKHSVSRATNIYPDLICIGKAMANGLPLAAVGGRKEILDGNYFVSSTYAGETLSLASCRWTIDMLLNSNQYTIEKLWEAGSRFIKRFNEMGSGLIAIEGYPTRGVFKGDALTRALFFQEAVRGGFLFGPSFFYSFANAEHDFAFFTFFKDFIDRLKLNQVRLDGEMPRSPFAERVRSGR